MAKGRSNQYQPPTEQGTPAYIILSILFALLIFAFEGIKATINVSGIDLQTQLITMGFIGLGLIICFFWRRVPESVFKTLSAFFFTCGIWVYLLISILLPLLLGAEDAAIRMPIVHQAGLGTIVAAGFCQVAALLYQQRPIPGLFLTTFAGFILGLGSLFPLLRPAMLTVQEELSLDREQSVSAKAPHTRAVAHAAEDDENNHRRQYAENGETGHGEQHETRAKPTKAPSKAPMTMAAKATNEHDQHWEYTGATGQENWGQLAAAFKLCRTGLEQSPISIPSSWPVANNISLDYRPSNFQVVDNGHTIQVNPDPGNFATIDQQRYELKQFHFHIPSEHLLDNRASQMEVHFVHANSKGQLGVIGAWIAAGEPQREYQKLWSYFPVKTNTPIKPLRVTLDLRQLLPQALTAYHYAGSLTTPPCSEGVNWNVLTTTLKLSPEQIDQFKKKYRLNARQVQPLGNRKP